MKNRTIIKLLGTNPDPSLFKKIEEKESLLSAYGEKKLVDEIADNYVRLVKRSFEQRGVLLLEILDNLIKYYNSGTAHMKNPYIESIKRPVVALDKKTGALIQRYESIRDAWHKTGVYHGTIYHCVAHDRPNGYKTGGGFVWMYEEDWLEQKKNETE